MMNRTNVVFAGFMLFSLFFGARNLIFPPLLGLESGSSFGPAITGFLFTGVLLPFMAIMAVALSDVGSSCFCELDARYSFYKSLNSP